ncbi:hypothetical protein LAUMK13_03848 [Mycobacterium innocens]|uniref:Uncharacterized protein n=1 Tax=Mycobacterium innocens TaxID=2341083 RepID=A0A498QB61_9MYCO|nr:hypothetical protein LAUMK13_03848 [Mycobacterium innocens]
MAADTSSAPAAAIAVVGKAAAALALLIAEPIPASSVAAASTNSGTANTNDIYALQYVLARAQPGPNQHKVCGPALRRTFRSHEMRRSHP